MPTRVLIPVEALVIVVDIVSIVSAMELACSTILFLIFINFSTSGGHLSVTSESCCCANDVACAVACLLTSSLIFLSKVGIICSAKVIALLVTIVPNTANPCSLDSTGVALVMVFSSILAIR